LPVKADSVAQSLIFSQNWTNTGLITANDNWSGVSGIEGFLGQDITTSTNGADPQTLLGTSALANDLDVIANQTSTAITNGGVAEFEITNPTIALQGSGTADAPYVLLHLNTTGQSAINVSYNLRDVDGSGDNAIQKVALQFRVGSSGNFTNIPAGFVPDATTGPSLATLVTPVSVTLPAVADNKPLVQVRVITSNASGNDEWVGIDDIVVSGTGGGATNPTGVGNANPSSVAAGGTTLLTVAVTPGTNPPSVTHAVSADLSSIGGAAAQAFLDNGLNGDALAGDNTFSFNATVSAGTSGGAKTLPVTINETSPNARTGTASISLNVLAPTNPSGTGTASPNSLLAGASTLLTVNVTPGTNPPSSGINVSADLSSIGGAATQAFADNGGNSFTFTATVATGTTPGAKTLPVTINDAEGRSASASIILTVEQPPTPLDHMVISQIYGGGGNAGATFRNDYVELYNAGTVPFDLGGWTVQYGAATGTTWQAQPLGGVVQPGEYYLVALASGGAVGALLPEANVDGSINMSATAGKVALVSNGDPLDGCPVGVDPGVVDFVGYGGTANCREGATNAPAGSNTSAIFRKNGGFTDTNVNGSDFVTGAPNPRRTTPIVEIGPYVLNVDPRANAANAPRDASLTVTFTEQVEVTGAWFNIECVSTGLHNDATVAGSGSSRIITPNVNFQPGEKCTATVFKDFVSDSDSEDGPDTNNLQADYTWSFNIATGSAPAYGPEVHLTMGNPNDAVADANQPNNYLMEKPEFALSYNRDRGTPNWVSWHLANEWVGTLARVDTFRPDPAVLPEWYRVLHTDYTNSGFDRGHMVPNADRDPETSIPINQATFLMSNMLPQAPDNNQGPWANMENFLRTLLPANELYIVAGGAGTGGTGSNGTATTIANGHVTVPAQTWKVALVLPKDGGDDVARTTCGARTIAVIMPNTQGIRNVDWQTYITTVDEVEALTGYDFFSNLPDAVENCVEAGTNGVNPPGTAGQTVDTDEDTPVSITLDAASPNNNPLTYTIVNGPTHGTLSGTDANRIYTPAANYNGPDSFTFKVNDGQRDSNTSTVAINVRPVNDAPVASDDAYSTNSNTPLNVTAPGVLANDNDIDGGALSAQLVSNVSHGALALNADGSFVYTPAPNFAGTDSFTYRASDGTDNSNAATVSITVNDTVGPTIDSSVAVKSLWPANGKLLNVGLSVGATDNAGGPVNVEVFVYSDEDDITLQDGSNSPDAKDIAPGTLRLRAERDGGGDGRVYLIVVVATDSSGNTSRSCHTVVVAKSQSAASEGSVNQQAQAAQAHCETTGTPPAGYFVVGDGPVVGSKQ
jgi:endonuclease G